MIIPAVPPKLAATRDPLYDQQPLTICRVWQRLAPRLTPGLRPKLLGEKPLTVLHNSQGQLHRELRPVSTGPGSQSMPLASLTVSGEHEARSGLLSCIFAFKVGSITSLLSAKPAHLSRELLCPCCHFDQRKPPDLPPAAFCGRSGLPSSLACKSSHSASRPWKGATSPERTSCNCPRHSIFCISTSSRRIGESLRINVIRSSGFVFFESKLCLQNNRLEIQPSGRLHVFRGEYPEIYR